MNSFFLISVENYHKGKNVEEPWDKTKIPIPNLPPQFIWMQVNGGSKMRNVLDYALKAFKEEKAIVWSGSGAGLPKAISCAEIVKRRNRHLHQISKICYRKVEEFWEPSIENLESLVVVREVPTIHILLSKDPLNTEEPGYQTPGRFDTFWRESVIDSSDTNRRAGTSRHKNRPPKVTSEQFAAMGLRTDPKRTRNFYFDRSKQKPSSSRLQHETDSPESSANQRN